MSPADIPAVPPAESAYLQAKGGISGDGGNRTHATFPPSTHDLIRATALAMRDLAEQIGATDIAMTLEGGTRLTWDCDDGFHLLPPGVEELDITEWVDHAGLLPAEGVTSVRQQPELLARGRA